jgi:hypothetical protein
MPKWSEPLIEKYECVMLLARRMLLQSSDLCTTLLRLFDEYLFGIEQARIIV